MGLVTISEFARASGLTPKALRLYAEMGLLTPMEIDTASGYRRYAEHQLGRARLVARLRLAGMPLARIREVADLPSPAAAAALTSYWRQVEADTATARKIVALLVEELTHEEQHMTDHPAGQTARIEHAVRSGIGRRDAQLDAARAAPTLFAVADGFGGAAKATGVADAALDALCSAATGAPRTVAELDEAVRRAATAALAAADGDPGSGTTLTSVVLSDGQALVAHIGDSRGHLVREGRLERLTRDHTVVQTLVDEGRLTAEEARTDGRRLLINRALAAGAPPEPDLAVRATRPGDRLVLTTDGVHAVLEAGQLAELLVSAEPPTVVADAVAEAVEAAGAPDNWAVVVVDLAGGTGGGNRRADGGGDAGPAPEPGLA
ncbi:MerR family transcriptional regulator [Nocardioides panaciterrulae]|uniref:Protein phosphatase n=1 Tax=Nocardioides panaciterrulae TaxID=661492 RepID=A0A7Y9E445_9ACTN|nr:MerR family transcriptional regulator [Nocardioides panaciterrulae]NYD40610.1 protein phosphatase [Nocardioides panaciterrulae]